MLITNIQRFSLHDGPGIRTTVFLKGCSIRCPWCSNPENLNGYPEKYNKNGIEGIYGKEYSCDEVYDEIMKDEVFYEDDGGVTFSGGEALLQADNLIPLIKRIRKKGITVAVETCLFVPQKNVECMMPYVDFFYVDMKILQENQCLGILGGDIHLYKDNLKLLTEQKQIIIRIPVIGGYTDGKNNREAIIKEIKRYEKRILKIEMIKGHNLGKSKYESLNMEIPQCNDVSDDFMEQYRKEIENVVNIPVLICRI